MRPARAKSCVVRCPGRARRRSRRGRRSNYSDSHRSDSPVIFSQLPKAKLLTWADGRTPSQARAQLEQERVISCRLLRAALERVVEHCERSGEDPDVAFVEAATGCTVAELQRVPTEKANRLGNLGFLIAPESRHFVGNPGMLGLHAAYEDASMQPRHSMYVSPEDWNEWDPEKRDTHSLPCEM